MNNTLNITYQGFKQDDPSTFDFHPWYLKQYNDRWFLFGMQDGYDTLSNLALDRIVEIENSAKPYLSNTDYDFDELFEDVVGVSVNPDVSSQKVVLKVESEQWPYIKSKPIHGSQKVKYSSEAGVILELDLQINHELKAILFSYMDSIEVQEPVTLRGQFKSIAGDMSALYI